LFIPDPDLIFFTHPRYRGQKDAGSGSATLIDILSAELKRKICVQFQRRMSKKGKEEGPPRWFHLYDVAQCEQLFRSVRLLRNIRGEGEAVSCAQLPSAQFPSPQKQQLPVLAAAATKQVKG
jgi:hypothetical protein